MQLSRRLRSERIRHRTPTNVFHEQSFFLGRCQTALGFDGFQCADRDEVGFSLLLKAAFTDAVGGRYAEIVGKGWFGSSVVGSNESRGWSVSS